EKWKAVVDEVVEVHKTGRPILIGTTDVDKSIKLSELLGKRGVQHELLNALPEHAAREADIVAQAGRIGAVTISTNMAGRGTDIVLGGNPEFMAREEFRKAPEKYRDQGINPEPPNSPPAGSPPEALKAYADEYSRWRENWEK